MTQGISPMSASASGYATGEKGESKTRELERIRRYVPPELQPLLDTMMGAQIGATTNVANAAQQPMIPGLTPDQLLAERMGRGFATGEDGVLPGVMDFFGGAMSGQGLGDFVDPQALARMRESVAGTPLEAMLPGASGALQGIASGENLYGGAGFDRTVDAAVRAALPQIGSAFGSSRGGLSGALAKGAVGDRAVDAALRYQDAEKARQLQAMGLLGNLTGQGRGESLASAGQLLGMSGDERNRAFTAAGALPGLGMLGPEVLSGFGETRRANEEARRRNPFESSLQSLSVLQQNFPWQQLLGLDREMTADTEEKSYGKGSSGTFGF